MSRKDRKEAFNKLALGVIPAGTGNGRSRGWLRWLARTQARARTLTHARTRTHSLPRSLTPPPCLSGLANSLLYHSENEQEDYLAVAALVCRGARRALDIFSAQTDTAQGRVMQFGFLSVSWGLIADIDLESENLRCCGNARFTWAGVWRILCLRQYQAQLSFVRAPGMLPPPHFP